MNKLLLMLRLQQKLNDATNGIGWENGVTKDGKTINWRRCIYMESAEMIDSFGWKHWKSISQPTDYENLQIEVVDVWHFIMSLIIEIESQSGSKNHEAMAMAISQSSGYEALLKSTKEFAEDIDLMEKIESVMRGSLLDPTGLTLESLVEDFFVLTAMSGLDLDDLYRLYVGKNILNQFRQDNGYKEGTYIKVWNGLEDNAVMKKGWEENPQMSPEELYATLEMAYPKD